MKKIISILISLLMIFILSSCSVNDKNITVYSVQPGDCWCVGFSEKEIPTEEDKYYMAGYHNDHEVSIVDAIDKQKVKAVWLSSGNGGTILISVDCVGLTSDTIEKIRNNLVDFCNKTGCGVINVCSTHTHAGIDTMGLWGPVAEDGKSESFQEALIKTATEVSIDAYDNRMNGELYFSYGSTGDIQRDSRDPQVYDNNIYQLRFVPDEGSGIRILNYAAHAESLRGDNDYISADYPAELSKLIKEETGDDVIFFQGAIGGLIMTRELTNEGEFDAVENMKMTAERLKDVVLSLPQGESLEPVLKNVAVNFEIRMDNTLFLYYQFLGILNSDVKRKLFTNTYYIHTTLSVMKVGSVFITLVPGEIFPELVLGGALENASISDEENPEPLIDIAEKYGVSSEHLLIFGLANDEIGYIIPPSDFLLDESLPYFNEAKDIMGRNHYEETNSVGIMAAYEIATAFSKVMGKI